MASSGYTQREINTNDTTYANALNTKYDETNNYSKAEIDSRFTTSNLSITTLVIASSVDLGGICRMVKSVDTTTSSTERFSLTSVSNYNIWLPLFSIVYKVDTMQCNLYVDKADMLAKIIWTLNIGKL